MIGVLGRGSEVAPHFCESGEAFGHTGVEGAGGHFTFFISFAGSEASEKFEGFVDVADGPDMELPCTGGIDHLPSQHQIGHIGSGYQHALLARQACGLRRCRKSLRSFSLMPPTAWTAPN